MVDDVPIKGTRFLSDVYQRSNIAICEPADYEDVMKNQNWVLAMKEELSMIEKNKTWILCERPKDKRAIRVKWVYRTKLDVIGSINKNKARLVAKGYAQIFGVDYFYMFAPVAFLDTIRLLLAVAAQQDWRVYQLDVKSAFVKGYFQEEVYVEKLEGFVKEGEEDEVYLLKKALYGLKQAPRTWYSRIDEHLLNLDLLKAYMNQHCMSSTMELIFLSSHCMWMISL